MRLRWANLNEQDRAAVLATIAFLNGRLEDRATVDWALRLKPNDTVKRLALLNLIDGLGRRKIGEPWLFAWRLIEESWNHVAVEDYASTAAYGVRDRMCMGDKSGSLVTVIIELVAPRLKVEPFSRLGLHFLKPSKWPKKVGDLFSVGLTSGSIVDPGLLNFEVLTDPSFLASIAHALDAAVVNGLDIARRIGWEGERHLWKLGQLNRVYYVPVVERPDEQEPDEFHRGIAPSVKLLHAVVSRLVSIDLSKALDFVRRWKLLGSPVHLRLWAALSWDPLLTPANEVGALLLSLDDWRFWDLHDFPEIAELRAKRFSEFDLQDQVALTARIRKLPPRNRWSRKADPKEIKNSQLYWAVRELKRIETAGGTLPHRDKGWLDTRMVEFPDVGQMSRLDEGFLDSPKARLVPPNPDNRYDLLEGEERLKALETALTSVRGGWDEDPARGARDWISLQENSFKLLLDFESIPDDRLGFPKVWERFGCENLPVVGQGEDAKEHDLQSESARVLSLLAKLSEDTVWQTIGGISNWLSAWGKHVVDLPDGLSVWLKLWPIAVEVTNANPPVVEEVSFNTIAQSSYDLEAMDLDTRDTPAGKLVDVFLSACPDLQKIDRPFDVGTVPRLMRDTIMAVTGRAGLIARFLMIEELSYFRQADPDWTHEYLITPLIVDKSETIALLWRAIARRPHFSEVLTIIGDKMTDRATDLELDRKTRCSLVSSLIIESSLVPRGTGTSGSVCTHPADDSVA